MIAILRKTFVQCESLGGVMSGCEAEMTQPIRTRTIKVLFKVSEVSKLQPARQTMTFIVNTVQVDIW